MLFFLDTGTARSIVVLVGYENDVVYDCIRYLRIRIVGEFRILGT
jgi:hypothetical protein